MSAQVGNQTGYAGIAQSVEQLIRNQQVAGSSPVTSSKKSAKVSWRTFCFTDQRFLNHKNEAALGGLT